MKIAVAQMHTRAADLEANVRRIAACARHAAGQGCDLLILPVAALSGPDPVGGASQEAFMIDLVEALSDLADECPLPCLVPIVMDLDGETLPEAVLFQDGSITPLKFTAYVQAMRAGGSTGGSIAQAEDDEAFDLPVIELAGMRVGVAFTYDDLDDYEDAGIDVDALVYLAGYGFAADDPSSVLGADLLDNRYPHDAQRLGAWLVGAGSLGGYGTQVFTGASFVLDPRGRLVASSPSFEEDLLIADIGDGADDAAADPWQWRPSSGSTTLPEPEVYDGTFHLWQALVMGLHDYLEAVSRQDVVIGLDGSLSSQVVLALATDALGPTHVHALVCVPGDDDGRRSAEALARNLRTDARRLPARAIAASVVNPEPGAELTPLLTAGILEANLSAWAGELGGVVLSGEDKSGLALARDMNACSAAALAPLGDVYRTDVLALARMRNMMSPIFGPISFDAADATIPEGASMAGYAPETFQAAVDHVLGGFLEGGRSLNEMLEGSGQDAELIEAVHSQLAGKEPTRLGRVLYLMMSSRTLYDERLPLGLAWRDHPREQGPRELDDDELDAMFDQVMGSLAGAAGQPGAGAGGAASPRTRYVAQAPSNRGDVRSVLGDISDFSLGGGFRPSGFGSHGAAGGRKGGQGGQPPVEPDGQGPHGPDWQSPFSEN